jgi:hypothetical protein
MRAFLRLFSWHLYDHEYIPDLDLPSVSRRCRRPLIIYVSLIIIRDALANMYRNNPAPAPFLIREQPAPSHGQNVVVRQGATRAPTRHYLPESSSR